VEELCRDSPVAVVPARFLAVLVMNWFAPFAITTTGGGIKSDTARFIGARETVLLHWNCSNRPHLVCTYGPRDDWWSFVESFGLDCASAAAPVDDKSRAGALLPEEIPGILNMRAHCEPIVSCPVDFYAASLS